jgi:acetyltransferase-like isoleucine patch superfamily enzyme
MAFDLDPMSNIFMGAHFTAARHFVMKRNSVINTDCHIDVRGKILIGENVSISDKVSLVTGDHNPADPHFRARFRSIIIEDHVFIGHRSVILGNIMIGKGAVIAAGSVVTANVPPFTIVGGVPAKKIGERTRELLRNRPYSRLFH